MIKTSETSLADQIKDNRFDICIVDFGSTTVIDEQDPRFTATTSILRHATPEYAPPEMLTDTLPNVIELRQSPSIDIYAAASIIYELLTGRTPYEISNHPGEVPYLVKTNSSFRPLKLEGYESVSRAINAALSNDQAGRPSAEYMRDVFLNALFEHPMPPAANTGSSPAPAQHPAANASSPSAPTQPQAPKVMTASEPAQTQPAFTTSVLNTLKKVKLPRSKAFYAITAAAVALVLIFASVVAGLNDSSQYQAAIDTAAVDEANDDQADSSTDATYSGGALYTAKDPETGLWGYLNAQRQWVISPRFEELPGLFVDGLATAQDSSTNLYGYINTSGEWAIQPQFPQASMFGEGLAFVQSNSQLPAPDCGTAGLGGWIDTQGNWVIPPKYYGGGIFCNGLADFKSSGDLSSRWGYLNTAGEVVIPERFIDAKNFSDNGLAPAAEHTGYYGWIDKNGNWAIKPGYVRAGSFSEGLASFVDTWSEKWGYLDASGKTVLPAIYLSGRNFKSGVAAVQDENTGLWGFIDKTGAWTIQPKFARAGDFAHGLAPAQDESTKQFGYIDDTGHWVIPPQFSDINLNVMS